jgi:hypothetical protein
MLERLLAARVRTPRGRWSEAFLSSWAALGYPDFATSPLLPGIDEDLPFGEVSDETWRRAASVHERFVLTLITHPLTSERAHWLVEHLPTLDDPALFIAARSLLGDEAAPEPSRAQVEPVLRARLDSLVDAHPRSMQLHLLRVLSSTSRDEAFAPLELAALEAIASLPRWRETSTLEVFRDTHRVLRKAGVACPGVGASTLALRCAVGQGPTLLRKRAAATRSQWLPGSRHGLGRVLSRIGERLAEGPTLLEHLLGLGLMRRGAEDQQDALAAERIDTRRDESFVAQQCWRRAAPARWPLASFLEETWEATARDERAWLRTFLCPKRDAPHRSPARP